MILRKEYLLGGENGAPLSLDLRYPENSGKLPVILFCHGWKGFKDWGPFHAIADIWAEAGFAVIKMNFSHNGVSAEDLSDITDPENFGSNTFSRQLEDIGLVLEWIELQSSTELPVLDSSEINAVGHSLGGAMLLLKALEDKRIRKIVTWSAPADLHKYARLDSDANWSSRGFVPIENGRTKQVYPLLYAFKEDIIANWDRFDLLRRADELNIPCMIVHGTADETVSITDAYKLSEIIDHAVFVELEDAGHTFGGKHPWDEEYLTEDLELVVEETMEFFNL
ncbi:MAG: alpha/beta fold hydrolase [Flavobacteriales bacterium]|nr:alpha/beta fold hydrolase [Flavobacteriales bacterium]